MGAKKIPRRQRNKARKLNVILVLSSILISVVCIVIIVGLLTSVNRSSLISPLSSSFADFVNIEYRFVSRLEKLLKENKIAYKSISRLNDGSYQIILDDAEIAIVSSRKDINSQISSLQYVLSRLTMEGKTFSRLDMRFDKPVIVLK